jgi:rare lipoprotein A
VLIGDPFLVDGVTYTPADTLNYDSVGTAELAEPGEGAPRISGAHRTLPVPSYVEVTSLDSGRTILVRLDQRGPMSGDGLVGLSPMAWSQLGLPAAGSAPVRVRRVNPPEQERALLRTGQTAPLRMDTPPGLLAALRRKLGVEAPVGEIPAKPVLPAILKPATLKPATIKPPSAVKPLPPHVSASAAKPRAAAPVETAPPETPVPSSIAAARPAATVLRYYVQIGAFAQRGNANAAARRAGGSAVEAGRVWRVRSGPYASVTQADTALAKARRAGYADARIVREK